MQPDAQPQLTAPSQPQIAFLRTPSTAIHKNAEKLLALVESERNGAIAALTPQVIDIQTRLIQFQDRLSNGTICPEVVRELANMQDRFTAFRGSSGILEANMARIRELEALVEQIRADNDGVVASNAAALRDATVAREKEEVARKAFERLGKQLNKIGISHTAEGRLAFSEHWRTVLEEAGRIGSAPPEQMNIVSGLKAIAARLESEKQSGAAVAGSSSSDNTPANPPIEVIDFVDDSPTTATSAEAQ